MVRKSSLTTRRNMTNTKTVLIVISLMSVAISLGTARELARRKRSDGLEYLRPSYIMGRVPPSSTEGPQSNKDETTKDDMPAPTLPLLPWWARVLCWSLFWIIVILLVCCLYTLLVWCCVSVNPAPGEIREFKMRKERELGRPVDVYWNTKSRKLMWAEK